MTNLAIDHTALDPEAERPDLADTLGMLARLTAVRPMGRDARRLALALSAVDVEVLEGLVIQGEVCSVRWVQEWAVCQCGDGRHEFRRDAPHARGHWHSNRRDAGATLRDAKRKWATWEKHRPEPHMVTHLVATTATEIVR